MEVHPTPTAKQGFLPYTSMRNPRGTYPESGFVHCRQCGHVVNRNRHGYGIDGEGNNETDTTLLTDGDFENWTGNTLDSWTITGSTVTKESTRGYFKTGSFSAKLVRSGSDITIAQTVSTTNTQSQTLEFFAFVKSVTNSIARLRLNVNGTLYYSAYNIAQAPWQTLFLRVTTPASVTSLSAAVIADQTNGTLYADSLRLYRGKNPVTSVASDGCPLCGSYFFI